MQDLNLMQAKGARAKHENANFELTSVGAQTDDLENSQQDPMNYAPPIAKPRNSKYLVTGMSHTV